MNLTTIIGKLDAKYPRDNVHVTNYGTILSYLNNTNTSITINSTTYNPHRICFINQQSTVYLYVHTINKKYHKIAISSINTIT